MANVADLNLIQINNFPEVESPEDWIVVSDASGKGYKISKENFKAFLGTVTVTSPKPIGPADGAPELDGVYIPTVVGTYPNFGGLTRLSTDGYVQFLKNGAVYAKVNTPMPQADNKIPAWTAKTYTAGQQVIESDIWWEAVIDTTAAQRPGVVAETIWKKATKTVDFTVSESKNLFDKNTMLVPGFYINSSGGKATLAGATIARIPLKAGSYSLNKIPVPTVDQYRIENTSGSLVANGIIGALPLDTTETGRVITLAQDGFFYFNQVFNSNTIPADTIQIEEGDTVTDYEEYYKAVTEVDGIPLRMTLPESLVSMGDLSFETGKNWFDKNTMVFNRYINASNGALTTGGKHLKISVKAGHVFTVSPLPTSGFDTFRIENVDGVMTSYGLLRSAFPADTTNLGRVITIENDGYFLLSVEVTTPRINIDVLQIEEGETATLYAPYALRLASIKDKQLSTDSGGVQTPNKSAERFINRKVYYFGDSITAGTEGGYVKYINEILQCVGTNRGSSGATTGRLVAFMTNQPDRQNSNTPANPDYTGVAAVTIMIGTNGGVSGSIADIPTQSILNIPYGSVTNENEYWQSFPNTFYGNLGLCIEYVKAKNPLTRIFLIAPTWNNTDSWNNSPTVHDAVKEIAKFYSVYFIDALHESGIERKQLAKYSYDSVHLNALGNELLGKYLGFKILNS